MSWLYYPETACFSAELGVSDEVATVTGGAFSDTGDKLFLVDFTNDDVSEYSLSTIFDINSASYVDAYSVASRTTVPRDICFGDSGTQMYISSTQSGQKKIFQYSLSTGYDVSTASYTTEYNVGGLDLNPFGIDIKPDGTKFYFIGNQNRQIFELDLDTAWNISSASLNDSQTLSGSTSEAGIVFNGNGTRLYVGRNGAIDKYTLLTAYDVTTVIDDGTLSLNDCDNSFYNSLWFGSDSDKIYLAASQSGKVLERRI